tara:strand:+ start:3707 stop:3862 length:156 start_codon:yes stop_codon:yes gene_type:complete
MKTYQTEYKGFIVYYNDIFQLEAKEGLIDAGNTWAYGLGKLPLLCSNTYQS